MNEILKQIYKSSAYVEGVKNTTEFDELKVGSPVYGEVTQKGTEAIMDKFSEHFNKDAKFYDFGSGLGKMVAHVGLVTGAKSIGIEYSKERHNGANMIKENHIPDCDNVSFKNGNVLDFDLSDATVIYMDNTVFPDNISLEIYNKVSIGCLMLYKKKIKGLKEEQNYQNDLVERTYHQRGLYWMTKSCNL